MFKYLCVVALLVPLVPRYGICQNSLGDVALRMATEREKLVQYTVDIRATGNYDYTKAGRSGEVADRQIRQVIEQHIEYSRLDKHAILAQRVSANGNRGSWFLIGESDGVVFLKRENEELQVNGAVRLAPVPRDEYPCRCVDPRAIGMLTYYHFMVHTSLETLLGGMLTEPTASVKGAREKDLIKFDEKSLAYAFDASRGYCPLEMRFNPGKHKLHWKTEVEQVEGNYLPVKATLEFAHTTGGEIIHRCPLTITIIGVGSPRTVG